MVGGTLQRKHTRCYWLIAGVATALGSVSPDSGHFLNIVTNGTVSWDYFHHLTVLFAWVFGASTLGLIAVLLRGVKHG